MGCPTVNGRSDWFSRASHCRTTGCTGLDLVATPFVRGKQSISTCIQQKTAVTCMAVKSTNKARIDQNWLGQRRPIRDIPATGCWVSIEPLFIANALVATLKMRRQGHVAHGTSRLFLSASNCCKITTILY